MTKKELEAENAHLRAALEKIAKMGCGVYSLDIKHLVDEQGDLWIHWAERAQRALDGK